MFFEVGKLTSEETKEIVRQCIPYLLEEDLYEVLEECLDKEDKKELAAKWEDL